MSINSNTWTYIIVFLFLLTFGIVQQIPFAPPSTYIQFLISHQHFWRFVLLIMELGWGKEWNFRIFPCSIQRPPPTLTSFRFSLEFLINQIYKKPPNLNSNLPYAFPHMYYILNDKVVPFLQYIVAFISTFDKNVFFFVVFNLFLFLSSAKISQNIKMIINATRLTPQNLIIPSLVECVL